MFYLSQALHTNEYSCSEFCMHCICMWSFCFCFLNWEADLLNQFYICHSLTVRKSIISWKVTDVCIATNMDSLTIETFPDIQLVAYACVTLSWKVNSRKFYGKIWIDVSINLSHLGHFLFSICVVSICDIWSFLANSTCLTSWSSWGATSIYWAERRSAIKSTDVTAQCTLASDPRMYTRQCFLVGVVWPVSWMLYATNFHRFLSSSYQNEV